MNRVALNAYISVDNNRDLTRDELLDKIRTVLNAEGWNDLGPSDYVNPKPKHSQRFKHIVFHCHKTVRITFEEVIVQDKSYTVAVPRIGYLWCSEETCASPKLMSVLNDQLKLGETFKLGTLKQTKSGIRGHKTPFLKVELGQLKNELDYPNSFVVRLDPRLLSRMEIIDPMGSFEEEILGEHALQTALLLGKPLKLPMRSIQKPYIQFARDMGKNGSEVSSLGILEAPSRRVGIILCASSLERGDYLKWLQDAFLFQNIPNYTTGRGKIESFRTIWESERKFGLPIYELADKIVRLDSKVQLASMKYLENTIRTMKRAGFIPVCVCFLPSQLPDEDFSTLMQALGKGGCKTVPVTGFLKDGATTSDSALYRVFVNIALQLAEKANAVPWKMKNVEKVTSQTSFLGVDLGHDHHLRKSTCTLTIVSDSGLVGSTKVLTNLPLKEQLTDKVFEKFELWLRDVLPEGITHLILHRDGKICEGERELWKQLGERMLVTISIVEIKKDTDLRFCDDSLTPGTWVELTPASALLVTSTQAQSIPGQGPPRPIEICLSHSDSLSLEEAVIQVFALCNMHRSTTRHRLPVTTERSNNLAYTGIKSKRSSLGQW